MFAKPRPKKSLLPPPSKRRRTESAVAEISFDNDARQEYLTGFHKRKQQRIKHAQEEAAKKAHQEKLDTRKQLRAERRRDAEEHVEKVNQMLRESGAIIDNVQEEDTEEEQKGKQQDGPGEWEGFPDRPNLDVLDHEEEYIDEDRYTTVTVETVSVSRDGLSKPEVLVHEDGDPKDHSEDGAEKSEPPDSKDRRPKKKKQKFRYESRTERQLADRRQKSKGKPHRA